MSNEKITVTVAARGTHHKDINLPRRREGFSFRRDPSEVEVTAKQYVAIAEDSHLIVMDGPPLAEAKAQVERELREERLKQASTAGLPSTVDFANRDEVGKGFEALHSRNRYLEEQNAELQATANDLREDLAAHTTKLDQVLERLGKLETAKPAEPTKPAEPSSPPAEDNSEAGKKAKKSEK